RSETQLAPVELGVGHAELPQRFGWTAVPIRREDIADVAEIFDPRLTRPESRGSEIAEAIEKGDAVDHADRGFVRPRDVVEYRFTLGLGRVRKWLPKSFVRLGIEPAQPIAHPFLAVGAVRHREVYEFRNTGVGGAAGSFVLRKDHLGKDAHRPIFSGGEELRRIGGSFCR